MPEGVPLGISTLPVEVLIRGTVVEGAPGDGLGGVEVMVTSAIGGVLPLIFTFPSILPASVGVLLTEGLPLCVEVALLVSTLFFTTIVTLATADLLVALPFSAIL